MARPKTATPVWSDLTYERWATQGINLQAARALRVHPTTQALVTVLTNERPSARGVADAQFTLGYEECLRFVRQFLDGVPVVQAPKPVEVTYATPESEDQLNWK